MLELIAVDETNEISIHEVATMITDAMGLNNGLQVESDSVSFLFIIDQVDYNITPLFGSSLDAEVRGHAGVQEQTDHKPRNVLSGGLAEELARNQNYETHQIYTISIYI